MIDVQMKTLIMAGAGAAGIALLAVVGAVIAKRRGSAGGVSRISNKADGPDSRRGAWGQQVYRVGSCRIVAVVFRGGGGKVGGVLCVFGACQ